MSPMFEADLLVKKTPRRKGTMSPFFLQGRALGPPLASSSYNKEKWKMVMKELFTNPLNG
jgi:hypothetical protein